MALDLGCGAVIDAKFLAENGFKVEAIDSNQNCVTQTKKICKGLDVRIVKKDIRDYKIQPDKYHLIISWNTLPFLKKKEVGKILHDIQKGLKKDSFFIFGIFGPEDDWAKNHPEMSFWTIEELKRILHKMEFIKVLEEKERKAVATGEVKFWHQIQGIARRK